MSRAGKFELNKKGVREMLRSEELKEVCRQYAAGIQARAGEGFAMDTYTGRNRVNAMVAADTYEAYRACMDDNALLKAVR